MFPLERSSSQSHSEPVSAGNTQPDVLVLGGGMAGLCAAISAREAGARVMLAEESPFWRRGGNARHGRNMRVPHDLPGPFSPDAYLCDELIDDLIRVSEGAADPDLVEVLASEALTLTDWLLKRGVHFQPAGDGVLPKSRRTVFFLGGGTAMISSLYREAERLGVGIIYEAKATAVDVSGRMQIRYQDRTLDMRPRATIVATGGYQANRTWLREGWGPSADRLVIRGTKHAQGGPLRDLLDQGAASSGDPRYGHIVAVDARSPEWDGGIVTRIDGVQYGLVVNSKGRRFFDEGRDLTSTRYGTWGRMALDTSDQLAWAILDSRAVATLPGPFFPPIEAGNIDHLARMIKIEPEMLSREVLAYNELVAADPTGRSTRLVPPRTLPAPLVAEPPFRAVPFRPGITFTGYGVRVDPCARLMRRDGSPVENLYAAGMIMGPSILGQGYISGAALMIAGVFGRIAGRHAARGATPRAIQEP